MSSRIKVLDSATAMKIAAGEVIEKPASAVRELIDNALDAGATWISIDTEQGGKEFLAVHDNGMGMSEEDIQKCYLNHATSKIEDFNDLMNLKTFGFRGEALASLAEISRVEISSRNDSQDHGSSLIVEFGQKESLAPKGMNQGTSIIINKFFQNVPARLKFLNSDVSEYRAIIQEMLKKALAKPEIAFELSHNKEKKYQLSSSMELFDRIVDIFPELRDVLKPFIYEEDGIRVYGFLSIPSWYKPTRNYQYLFVNGRAIEWVPFKSQISVAYNNLLPPSKFPAVFCYIDIDTDKIDFNVHPQKKEIRFDNEKKIADVVRRGVRRGVEASSKVLEIGEKETFIKERSYSFPSPSKSSSSFTMPSTGFTPRFRNSMITSNPAQEQLQTLFQREEISLPEMLSKASYIGMIFHTYLIFEQGDSTYFVDFHAMHERIRYEQIIAKHQTQIPSQGIIPIVFELARHEADIFEEIDDSLQALGFMVHKMSPTSFSIDAIPSVLKAGEAELVLRELFVSDLSIQDSYIWDSLCKIIACKGSSHSGDHLDSSEVDSLLKEWKQCENPQSCPHGRPIVVPMSRGFFDKQFKRTGF